MPLSKLRFQVAPGLIIPGLILIASMLGSAANTWAQAPFTVEQVLSSPFPTNLVAATHSSRVAWVFDAKGVRNVWIADGPDFAHTARAVTHYDADNGQPIASLRLTPDGKTAVFVVGSELNGEQESANPESWTKGAKQQVFALDVDAKPKDTSPVGRVVCKKEIVARQC
jgi:hypothetical protein